jgi:hypothetical protein
VTGFDTSGLSSIDSHAIAEATKKQSSQGTVVEEINRPGKGVTERSFSTCGDYTPTA